jgi:hypothetical protein
VAIAFSPGDAGLSFSGIPNSGITFSVPELSPAEIRAILDKLDEVCRQAQDLQRQLREQMLDRARRDYPARSAVPAKKRHKTKR